MPLKEGTNYIFVLANPDSIVRLKSKIDPFYDFQSEEIEELPFLFASPSLIPRFLYFLEWNQISFSHKSIDFMAYLSFEKEKIFSKGKRFPEPSFEIANDTKYPIQQNPYLPIGSIPFQIVRGESNLTSIGAIKPETLICIDKEETGWFQHVICL